MWIFGFSPGVCPMELRNLVSFLEYLVSNGRQVLLGDIRLGDSATNWLVLFVHEIQTGRVFRGTQLRYIGLRIAVSVRWYDLAMV